VIYYIREWCPDIEHHEPHDTFVDFEDFSTPTIEALLATQRVVDPEGDTVHDIRATMPSITWLDGSCCNTVHWSDYLALDWFFTWEGQGVNLDRPLMERFESVAPGVLQQILARSREKRPREHETQDAFERVLAKMETSK